MTSALAASNPAAAQDEREIVYVCVVSDFNLPELEACQARRPAHVLLVMSPRFEEQAQSLSGVLHEALPGVSIEVLSSQPGFPFEGDGIIETQRWAHNCLRPVLERMQAAGLACVLNLTGGTKAMTLVLSGLWPWDAIDYLGIGRRELEVVRKGDSGLEAYQRLPLAVVSARQVVRLYSKVVNQPPENVIMSQQREQALQLARDFWQAQVADDAALAALFAALERVWGAADRPEYKHKQLELAWPEFIAAYEPNPAVLAWMRRIGALAPDVFRWGTSGICLPGNRPAKLGKALRNWVSGIWLEQLVQDWLHALGLHEHQLAFNLKAGEHEKDSAYEREVDVLIHHANTTRLIEIKAGLAPGHKPSELRKQVESLGDRFGRTGKALLLGPQLCRQLERENRWLDFEKSCIAARVTLCRSQDDVNAFLAR